MILEDVLQLLYIVFAAGNLAICSELPCPCKDRHQATATEAVAQMEDAHVTFMDFKGHERYDVAMLGPGASAFLSGFGLADTCSSWSRKDTPFKMSNSIDAGTSFILEVMVNVGAIG